MIFKRIDHMEIVPSNPEETIDFYANILGFSIKSRIEVKMPPMREVVYLELGDTVIEIIAVDDPNPKSVALWEVGYRGVALEVSDMGKAVNFLQSKGVGIALEPVDLGDSLRAEIRDPDGLIIELRQWK
ncbi:MAG: VOC family protein [Desulfuromonadaceae bacterium]|nr:VOC family protein [Desulfuromonadaceae bacterium]